MDECTRLSLSVPEVDGLTDGVPFCLWSITHILFWPKYPELKAYEHMSQCLVVVGRSIQIVIILITTMVLVLISAILSYFSFSVSPVCTAVVSSKRWPDCLCLCKCHCFQVLLPSQCGAGTLCSPSFLCFGVVLLYCHVTQLCQANKQAGSATQAGAGEWLGGKGAVWQYFIKIHLDLAIWWGTALII